MLASVVVMFAVALMALFALYLVVTRRIKWRGREILELAAEPVKDTQDGYTECRHGVWMDGR
jgi:hypothetical protein